MDKTETEKFFSLELTQQRELELRAEGYSAYFDNVFLQRLKGVSFLGVLDSVYEIRKPSNRYSHSVCVSYLALSLARKLSLPLELERAFVIANILHDVGHAAFSHNSEPFLLERLNLYHEGLQSAFFLRTNQFMPNGITLAQLLENESKRVANNVIGLILHSRKAEQPLGDLFRCPLNCDKIEGNHRTLSHLGYDSISPVRLLNLFHVRDGHIFLDSESIDLIIDFWIKERDLYWHDIYTSAVFSAEAMLTRALNLYFLETERTEEFLLMTDREAYTAMESCSSARRLVKDIQANILFASMQDTHLDILKSFENRLRVHRFDSAIRREVENEIAGELNVPPESIISHFSRRKHFVSRLDELRQMDLFDSDKSLMPIERVVRAFKNSKKSGDFFDVFWTQGSCP